MAISVLTSTLICSLSNQSHQYNLHLPRSRTVSSDSLIQSWSEGTAHCEILTPADFFFLMDCWFHFFSGLHLKITRMVKCRRWKMGDINGTGTGRAEFVEMSPLKWLQWISGSQRNETGLKKLLEETKSSDCKRCGCWTHKAQQYPTLERTLRQWRGKIAFAKLCFPMRQPKSNGNSHTGEKDEWGKSSNAQLGQEAQSHSTPRATQAQGKATAGRELKSLTAF